LLLRVKRFYPVKTFLSGKKVFPPGKNILLGKKVLPIEKVFAG